MTPIPLDCANCPIHHERQHMQAGIKATYQRKFDIATELKIVCEYCKGKSSPQLATDNNCTQDTIQNIVRRYNQPLRSLRNAQLLRRGSHPQTFPLSKEIPHLIAIMLLTDGGAGKRKGRGDYITFTNKAESLHAIFADLIHYYYHQPPSAYFQEYWSKAGKQGHKAYYTTYNRKNDTEIMLNELLKLSPIYRTRPRRNQTWEDFLKETPQPSIQFLFDPKISNKVHSFGLRLAMSTEGTISPIFKRDSRFPYPHLTFACKHPELKRQWQAYFQTQEFSFNQTNEMIETAQLRIADKFLKIGGFIKGVKVKINSYYRGLDKQAVLKAILIDRKKHPIPSKLPKQEKHKILRQRATQFQEP